MTMTVDDYLGKITPSFAGAPNFVSTVRTTLQPIVAAQNFLLSLPSAFDIDQAVGAQLDAVGDWVGISRKIPIPIPAPWFAWGDPNHGWGSAVWKQAGISSGSTYDTLDDVTYRRLLKATVAANYWDGTAAGAQEILFSYFFAFAGTNVWVEDRGDLSVMICLSGELPPIADLEILGQQLIPLKPQCVASNVLVTSVNGGKLFGFGVSNDLIDGWGFGSWGARVG